MAVFSAVEPIASCATWFDRVAIGTGVGSVIVVDVRGIEFGPDSKPDTSDQGYEQLLRRGLEFSRKQKGEYHEETLAHLTGLSVHLENMGKSAEARDFAEERDTIVARIKDGGKGNA